jgi:hypothetical protein
LEGRTRRGAWTLSTGSRRYLIRHLEPVAPHAATTPQAGSSHDRPTERCVRRGVATQRARGPQPETADPRRLLDRASAVARAPQPCRAYGPQSLPGEHSRVAPSFRRADMSSSCGSVPICERLLRQFRSNASSVFPASRAGAREASVRTKPGRREAYGQRRCSCLRSPPSRSAPSTPRRRQTTKRRAAVRSRGEDAPVKMLFPPSTRLTWGNAWSANASANPVMPSGSQTPSARSSPSLQWGCFLREGLAPDRCERRTEHRRFQAGHRRRTTSPCHCRGYAGRC